MAAFNQTLVNSIGTALAAAGAVQSPNKGWSVLVDGGPMDAATTIGLQLGGHAIFGAFTVRCTEKNTYTQVDADKLEDIAKFIDVTTVSGFAGVTRFHFRALLPSEVTLGATDGVTF